MANKLIISHKNQFIFIKTSKTAGSSIEVFLSKACGSGDVITPIYPEVKGHIPRNYTGYFNPIPEVFSGLPIKSTISNFLYRKKFYNHITGLEIRNRVSKTIWNNYYKFCFERPTADKLISLYRMLKERNVIGSVDEFIFRKYYTRVDNRRYYMSGSRCIIDSILDFDNLHRDLDRVLKACSIQLNVKHIPHIKRSSNIISEDDVERLQLLGKELNYGNIPNR